MHRFPLNRRTLLFIAATFFLGGFLMLSSPAKAAIINVTSDITSDTTWLGTNTYVIQGGITVNSGVTLTVASGTVVKFATSSNNTSLDIQGILNVQGAASKKVFFTRGTITP